MEHIYTTEKLSEYLGLSPKTIREMAAAGTLKGYKKNGQWFFIHSDVLKYIKEDTPKNAK